ncbi:hypothetical protein KIW84_072899 [Lathyrus oleraceus]|uniref:Gag-pol polyprotein n=1 Tax=Pisum sativum TaxID=3888 RepID=A0A9D4ZUY1_PEA|nr:hypothetical protein KIW84_072899 [Pisum sativum]
MQDMHLSPKVGVTREEAGEFLRIIKKSDYKVVDQLNQTPSKISMLSLILNSEAHRNSLLKVLSAAHITKDITIEQFDDVIACVTTGNFLGFNDDELPIEGKNHNKALHISLKCMDTILSRVLVDTGSSLNVMPKPTLIKLPVEGISVELDRSRSREDHSRSGNLVSGHTRMALGNTRMRWSGTRMALGNTRMDEEDDVLNVFWSLLVRVWGCGTRSIRVWDGDTRMGFG